MKIQLNVGAIKMANFLASAKGGYRLEGEVRKRQKLFRLLFSNTNSKLLGGANNHKYHSVQTS